MDAHPRDDDDKPRRPTATDRTALVDDALQQVRALLARLTAQANEELKLAAWIRRATRR